MSKPKLPPTIEALIAALSETKRRAFFQICKIIAESDDPTVAEKIIAEAHRLLEEQERRRARKKKKDPRQGKLIH